MQNEIITLQFGHYANFVGSHYWNIQDELISRNEALVNAGKRPEIGTDDLFRTGITQEGIETYTPRVLIFDARGSLGALRRGGYQYDTASVESVKASSQW
jgi:hypothetical protein